MYYILIVVYGEERLQKPSVLVISYSTSIITFPCLISKCIKRNFITVIQKYLKRKQMPTDTKSQIKAVLKLVSHCWANI
jgi:hypothetical protein